MLPVLRARHPTTVKEPSGARWSREQQIWGRRVLRGEYSNLGAGSEACKAWGKQSPWHTLLLLGVPKPSPTKEASRSIITHREGAFAMGARLRDSGANKLSWMLMPSIRMDPPMSLGMCDSFHELSPSQSHSHCCRRLVLYPKVNHPLSYSS